MYCFVLQLRCSCFCRCSVLRGLSAGGINAVTSLPQAMQKAAFFASRLPQWAQYFAMGASFAAAFPLSYRTAPACAMFWRDKRKKPFGISAERLGDPYENRTRVTAVKGRCLDRLTNGP